MIDVFEHAIDKIRALPAYRQREAAELLEQLAAAGDLPYALSDAERAILEPAIERALRGKFASDDDVTAALRKPWR